MADVPSSPSSCALDLSSLDPTCTALNKGAGTYDFIYGVKRADIEEVGYNVLTGYLNALTLTDTAVFVKMKGRKHQNGGTYEMKVSPTGSVKWMHKVSQRIYHETQLEREAIEALALAEDLVFFIPTGAGQIEVFGIDQGLAPATGKGGTGVKQDDDNTFVFEYQGDEPNLPVLMLYAPSGTATLATTITYLDSLVTA